MKFFVSVIFAFAVFFIQEHDCLVKVLDTIITIRNPKYTSEEHLQKFVDTYNETFNYELLHWNLTSDLATDLTWHANVYVINSVGKRTKFLTSVSIPVCKESSYRKYLPSFFRVPSSQLNKPCIKKGNYYTTYAGEIDIEQLIFNLGLEGKYFETENTLTAGREIVDAWITTFQYYSDP